MDEIGKLRFDAFHAMRRALSAAAESLFVIDSEPDAWTLKLYAQAPSWGLFELATAIQTLQGFADAYDGAGASVREAMREALIAAMRYAATLVTLRD